MNVIYYLIPVAIIFVIVGVIAFFGQQNQNSLKI
ncbi:cbb3-type cytochrome oxidase assembly protein CcoS [Psychrosphaera aquimarina]|uniref:Cbb3-type cytochrome oxidase assembly protein CcoS n=1 Tax=Psychrosphaera aquimarina TaxID=2044854 RepID=A0ABU3QXI3_9GAMM|nr:cbb3-type cytochrome oxidase assembly protein CcoS [Psychrosphaera aquimarina]MDU0111758.1 cbb3-type cytochrome oxidase assembly protein CcoS [Psychrosphaera aquimarina]